MATQFTYNEDISQRYRKKRTRAPHSVRLVPFQPRHAFTGLDVPHLETITTGNDAPPIRKHGNAANLQQRQIIIKVLQKADAAHRTMPAPAFSVATHLPVAMSHTLSVWSTDPDTMRRPSGKTATQ